MKMKLQFTVGIMLFATALVAGYFAGQNRGYVHGQAEWTALPTFAKTYKVDTLVFQQIQSQKDLNQTGTSASGVTQSTFDPIVDGIKNNVLPHAWRNDPNTTIEVFPAGLLLIVHGNATVHHEIDRHLALEQLNVAQKIADYQKPKNGG